MLTNYTLPTLILAARLSAVANGLFPPCASMTLGAMRFFNAIPHAVWYVNATDYGHVDFCDPWLIAIVGDTDFCIVSKAPKDVYRDFVAGMLFVAVKVFLDGDQAFASYMTQPKLMPVATTMQMRK
jgi:hypothetical protein